MKTAIYIGLSRQLVVRRQMEIIANNLANATTNAFKGERMMFAEHVEKVRSGEGLSFVRDVATRLDMRPGNMIKTSNPLDLAIKGDGWFVIDTRDGERYSRDGSFTLAPDGTLVNQRGQAVLGEGNDTIVFSPTDTDIVIKADGTVTASGIERGRLRVVSFDNPQVLEKTAGNMFRTDAPANAAEDSQVVQGMIEGANVLPIIEMTKMIAAQRSYEGAQKLINDEHDRQRLAIRKLTDTK
jgi:flagellar basal-body rod protein FlgF